MQEESKLLGKTIAYPQEYCPEILVAVPRSINREIYGIYIPEQLFCGYDSWHAYEASFLLDNGMPVTGILKIVYPATSPAIIESKSLKLYLGSYHMTKMGMSRETAIPNYILRIETDLSHILSTQVKVCFYGSTYSPPASGDFDEYTILEDQLLPKDIHFSEYQEHPAYLSENILSQPGEIKVGSHLLKSNCKITGQPDWGNIYIRLKASRLPSGSSLLKYIVSLRNENHFHEEICEMMYKRLADLFQPEILMVCCLYTRRGGIDICPVRANRPVYLPSTLIQSSVLTQSSYRQ